MRKRKRKVPSRKQKQEAHEETQRMLYGLPRDESRQRVSDWLESCSESELTAQDAAQQEGVLPDDWTTAT